MLRIRREAGPVGWVERRPLAAAVSFMLIWTLVSLAGQALLPSRGGWATALTLTGLALVALGWTGRWGEAGFTRPSRWRHLRLVLLPLLALAFSCGSVLPDSPGALLVPALAALLVAFQSEAWHRGLILGALARGLGGRRAAVWSGVLFAAGQMAHLIGGAPGALLVKGLVAAMGGFILAVLRLRTGTVWPGALLAWGFYTSLFLGRVEAGRTGLEPVPSQWLAFQAFFAVVVFGCALVWIRALPDRPEADAKPVRSSA